MSTPEHLETSLVRATEEALELIGGQYKIMLSIHLKSKYNSGLEMISSEHAKFHKAVTELFGEYSGKVLEDLIMECLMKNTGIKVQNTKDFAEFIKKMGKVS